MMNARHPEATIRIKRETTLSTCFPGHDGMVCEGTRDVLEVSWLPVHPILQGQQRLQQAKLFAGS